MQQILSIARQSVNLATKLYGLKKPLVEKLEDEKPHDLGNAGVFFLRREE